MKNILLPTDFSDNAWSAAVYALKLYSDVECTFYFLHSSQLKVSAMSSLSNRLLRTMSENALKDLKELKLMAETSNANANHNFEIILSSRGIEQAIEIAIENHAINMVVMGTKGATAAIDVFFGSNTVQIINSIRQCPILAIPDEFDFVKPKQIAFPTDFNRSYSDKELRPLKDLAELYNSKIRVVSIVDVKKLSDVQEYNTIKLEEYLENHNCSIHYMPRYNKKYLEIIEFITDLDIDILAMIKYKHSFIEGIIKEPVIKKIGFRPYIPFLVIPE